MTESDWLGDPPAAQWLMNHLGDIGVARTKAGRRRLRLFACACCRVAWDAIPDDRLRAAVEAAERFADGEVSKEALASAAAATAGLAADSGPFGKAPTGVRVAVDMAIAAASPQAYSAAFTMTATVSPLAGQVRGGEAHLARLIRDVFGNPFRPVRFDRAWRTSAAVALAARMYESRDFSAMPILADALQEAGCDHNAVLNHCRAPRGAHARGCWVVDGVLGKG